MIILLSLISLLLIYSFNQVVPVSTTTPTLPAPPISPTSLTTEDSNQKTARLEKLKQAVSGITNESFKIETSTEIADCDNEEAEKYEESIVFGMAKIAEGKVTAVNNSSLEMVFNQNAISWNSTIVINQATTISIIKNQSEQTKLALSSIRVGDTVVVQTTGQNITDAKIVATDIFKID